MQRNTMIWIGITLLTAIVQISIWKNAILFDSPFWINSTEHFTQNMAHLPIHFDTLPEPMHPAMPPLIAASMFIRVGVGTETALRISSAVLGTLATLACIVFTWKRFGTTPAWCVFVSGMLIFNRFLANSNVADAFAMPTIFLFFLAIYTLSFKSHTKNSVLLIAAIAGALALATRIHTAFPLIAPAFLILPFSIGLRRTSLLLGALLACWYLFTPLAWYKPWDYLHYALIGQTQYAIRANAAPPPVVAIPHVSLFDVAKASPIMVSGILLAIFFLCTKPGHPYIPKKYLIFLLMGTALSLAILQFSYIESSRYYYPLIMMWELFFFLLLLPLLEFIEHRYNLQKYHLAYVCAGLGVFGNVLMLATSLYL